MKLSYISLILTILLCSICYAKIELTGGKTIIDTQKNTAFVDFDNTQLEIDKATAKSNEKININLKSVKKITEICLDFSIDNSLIKINEIKINIPYSFDKNLKENEIRKGNSICYSNLNIDDNNIYFSAEYLGEGTIKYNITLSNGVILDPYLIGSLSTSQKLGLYLPFDGNISATYSSKINIFPTTNTRFVDTELSGVTTGSCINPTYAYDDNLATSGGGSSCTYYIEYSKVAADTGMVFQAKYETTTGLFGEYGCQGLYTSNFSIPSSCFNTYSNKVSLAYTTQSGTSFGVNFYCYDGSNYISIGNCLAGAPNPGDSAIYEGGVYITNQSSYTTYNNSLPQTNYINSINLTAGYLFSLNKNANNIISNKNGTIYNIIINNSGAIFNGINSTINTTLSGGDIGNNWTMFIEFVANQCSAVGDRHLISNRYPLDASGLFDIVLSSCIPSFYGSGGGALAANTPITPGIKQTVAVKTNSSNTSIYVNGKFAGSIIGAINITDNPYNIWLGQVQGVQYFNGSISFILIYNNTLSDNEINILSNQYINSTNKLSDINSAMNFTGNGYIEIENLTNFDASKYSICYWLYMKSSSVSYTYYFTPVVLAAYSGSYYYFNAYTSDTTFNIPLNEWVHLCNVYDGNYSKSYKNGILVSSAVLGSGYNMAAAGRKTLGGYYGSNTQLNGLIDEFLVYNYDLSSTEVSTIYNGYNSNIQLYFYNANTGLPVIDLITIKINNGSNEQTYITTAGNQFINNLNQGSYTLNIYSDTYLPRTQIITIGNQTSQTLNFYLVNTTLGDNVILTVKNKNQLYAIANSLISIYSYQNGSYYLTESKYSDISGRAQFSYLPNTNYKFIVSASGYQTYTFILDPIIFDTYDIYLDINSSTPAEFDKDNLYIYYTPKIFYNGTTTNFSYTISAPLSNLISYFYTITTPLGSTTYSGSNAMGGSFSSNINISNATISPSYSDTVRLFYGYTTSNGTSRNYTDLLDIGFLNIPAIYGNNASNNTFINLKNNTYGMGIFERILITTIIIIFCVGISMLIGQVIPGVVLGLLVMGYLVFIGFIPIWTVIISMVLGFFYITWKSGGY
jgi:hypothetical protein